MNTTSARELWSKLASAGMAAGEIPELSEAHTPWYVRVMQGIAGIIAACFLLGFVGIGMAFVMKSHAASIVFGLIAIAAAYAIFITSPRSDFGAMFALATSLSGQFLLMFGIFGSLGFDFAKKSGLIYALATVIQLSLAILVPNFIHRLISSYGAAFAFSYTCAAYGLPFIASGLVSAGVAWLWLNEIKLAYRHSMAAPISYGLTLSFIQMEGSTLAGHWAVALLNTRTATGTITLPWMGEALITVSLLATVAILIRRAGWALNARESVLAIAATLLVGAASFKAPGIAGGLMIVLLGFANGNRVLWGLGIASLLFYASSYYYLLTATLLFKSAVLLATGLALLAARWLVLNVIMPGDSRRA